MMCGNFDAHAQLPGENSMNKLAEKRFANVIVLLCLLINGEGSVLSRPACAELQGQLRNLGNDHLLKRLLLQVWFV
jgi:hypothetical protein